MPITGFRHVGLTVTDLERSARWYHDVLGFEERFRETTPERQSVIMTLPGAPVLVGLVHFPAGANDGFSPRRTGLDHLCLAVPTRDDLDAWAARLDALGVARSEIEEAATSPMLELQGPRRHRAHARAAGSPARRRRPRRRAHRREPRMNRQVVNPWTWQQRAGFVQANDVAGAARTLFCAGVVSVDDDGTPQHAGDMRAQALRALDNLETLLDAAGYSLADVVRLNTYVTDVDAYAAARPALQERLDAAGCRYAATLLGVSRLARPELLIELEATATA